MTPTRRCVQLFLFALASCTPGALTTIDVANGDRLAERVVPNFQTHGWDDCTLGDVASVDSKTVPNLSTITLKGAYPRELMVFNLPEEETPPNGEAPWVAPLNIQYASLPGINGDPTGFYTAEARVAWPVFMARVIDHGACRSVLSWTASTPLYPGGKWLNDTVYARLSQVLAGESRFLHPTQRLGVYQPSFLRPHCLDDSSTSNDDGFAINNVYDVYLGSVGGGIHVAHVEVHADYALFAQNGWIWRQARTTLLLRARQLGSGFDPCGRHAKTGA